MVVVSDASHLVGRDNVAVEVLNTRSTSQGCSSSPGSPNGETGTRVGRSAEEAYGPESAGSGTDED